MKCIALYECAAGIQRAVREDGAIYSRNLRGKRWMPWWHSPAWDPRGLQIAPDYHLVTPTPRVRLPKGQNEHRTSDN